MSPRNRPQGTSRQGQCEVGIDRHSSQAVGWEARDGRQGARMEMVLPSQSPWLGSKETDCAATSPWEGHPALCREPSDSRVPGGPLLVEWAAAGPP